ncbi:MAG: ABC-F family ATP-binding cassette domain-containing protein [Spirochaetales bacterium]|nr:ABC-F family ATP-binding cassette domain-containing protein [Spirochaetales bacterium]
MSSLHFQSVTFSYPSSEEDILTDISFELFPGWYGLNGSNGSGKTTLLKLASGELTPDRGRIGSVPCSYCPQEVTEMPPGWEDFLSALYDRDNRAGQLFSLLKLEHDWPYRWETLSYGERKRFQLAQLLWQDRSLFLVDEPTNHLDESSRRMILESLKLYRGIGLIVSHDRDFMDALCGGHLFLHGGNICYRPGTLSACLEQEERERTALIRERKEAAEEVRRLEREAVSRRRLAEGQQKRRSKAGLALKDHDSRFKKNLARITGKDGTGGKLLRQMDGRIDQARNRLEGLDRVESRISGITQHSRIYRGDRLLYLPEGCLPLGKAKVLIHGEITVAPGERIALTGDNGTGKTTLIGALLDKSSFTGEILYLPQETDRAVRGKLRERWDRLSPADRGAVVSSFSRLGGRPEHILSGGRLSPGEERKLLIALGVEENPALIILDEPTNHLDLPSVTALEEALAPWEGALLLVSHDARFRRTLTNREWRLREGLSPEKDVTSVYLDQTL